MNLHSFTIKISNFSKMAAICCIIPILIFFCCTYAGAAETHYKIFTLQHQTFAPYNNARKGFIEGLKKSDLWDQISIESYNAETNIAGLDQTIKDIAQCNDIDLLFTMGTQSTKKAVMAIKNIPIVFNVVVSPVRAGITSNWKASGANVTGISTPNQVLQSLAQLNTLLKYNSIGLIYLKGSPSHEAILKQIKIMSKRYGIKFVFDGFPLRKANNATRTKQEIQDRLRQSLHRVLPQVDLFYVQASGTFTRYFHIFREAFKEYQVPAVGDPNYIRKGIVVGIGADNFAFGKQAAEYALKILKGTPPNSLPMDTGKTFSILVNLEAAKLVNLNLSRLLPILNSANAIYQKIDQ